tara:strand:- start:1471 stop:1896 length:426 start_codon:yes stop_codon:yes gene_type:complete
MDKQLDFLVIDDEPIARTVMEGLLEVFGREKGVDVSVTLAEDGKVGLREYFKKSEEGHPYDCVFTDLNMPGIDGADVTKAIKQVSIGKTPVYIITADEETVTYDNLKAKLGSMAPDDIILKPFSDQKLEKVFDKIMGYSQD